jgi:hypothetical protein
MKNGPKWAVLGVRILEPFEREMAAAKPTFKFGTSHFERRQLQIPMTST